MSESVACPECGQSVDVGDRFCGRCGALVPTDDAVSDEREDGPFTTRDPPDVVDDPEPARTSSRVWLAAGILLVAVGAVARLGAGPAPERAPAEQPSSGPTATATAAPTPTSTPATVRWERDGLVEVEPDDGVRRGGDLHVLVGDRVVRTVDSAAVAVRTLPDAVGAIDDDGSFAVADGTTLTIGTLGGGGVVSTGTDVQLEGGVVAWRGSEPILRAAAGERFRTLVRVGRGGEVRWRTDRPVLPTGPHGDRWVSGVDDRGVAVVVDMDDGTVRELAGEVLAILDELVVLRSSDVVALDLQTGDVRWQRRALNRSWQVVGEQLVATRPDEVERVDPISGETIDRLTGTVRAVTRDGPVLQGGGQLLAVDWDGTPLWRRSLVANATNSVRPVDPLRLAVVADEVVTVLDATDGDELAEVVAPPRPLPPPVVAAGRVGVRADPNDLLAWVNPVTGGDIDPPDELLPTPLEALATEFGPVDISVGTAVLTASFSAEGSRQAWQVDLPVPLATQPVDTGALLVAALVDGTVLAIDPARGTVQWRTDLDALPSALAVTPRGLVVGTDDAQLVRLDSLGEPTTTVTLGGGPVLALAAVQDLVVAVQSERVVGVPLDE